MATSTITIISGASSITLDNTVSTLTLGTSGPAGIGVPSGGTTGQLLAKNSATNYDTEWIDNFTTDVRVTVKNDSGSTLAKGTVVYVSGANGTNILVKPAIATSDATSATTIGFLLQELAANATGDVITQGTITGLNTSAGTAGDPVWLSPTVAGGVVYGVANKPQAPNHLYSLGVLTRSNVNNGEIQVFVNNGWELEELHNVKITSPANNQVLAYDSAQSLWVNSSNAALLNTANAFTVGGHTITNTVAATIPLKIVAATGQSAATFAITDSVGGNIARFGLGGSNYFDVVSVAAAGLQVTGSAGATPTMISVTNSGPTRLGIVVKGAASQTANLQEWQDSAGTILSRLSASGSFLTSGRLTIGQTSTAVGQANVSITSSTLVGMIIQGAASQTANLQEWQNSAGSILAKMASDGQIFATNLSTINSRGRIIEYSNGAYIQLLKSTVTANPGANILNLAVRDGTTAGTLKLVVRAGAAGAETTILDNIPQ